MVLNPSNIFVKIAVGLALAAFAVGIVAVPVVYVNKRIDSAFEAGKILGYQECNKIYTDQAAEDLKEAQRRLAEEGQRALAAEKEAAQARKNAAASKRKLDEALAQTPPNPVCSINERATSILRDATNGRFTDEETGEPLPKPFATPVQPGANCSGDCENPLSYSRS